MSTVTSSDEDLVEKRVGRFVILRQLGAGAMGTVYEAHDPDLNRRVALKLVRQPGKQESMRLLREAQALAQLQHPSVVVIHDVGVTDDGVFIAMELVEGENLREHFAGGTPSWKRAVALYMQAGRGLAAAHDKSIVHRDFKPANVLIDREGRVRVTDFGLARLVVASDANEFFTGAVGSTTTVPIAMSSTISGDITGDGAPAVHVAIGLLGSPLTHDGALLGTPRYMAPEQHARRAATARSDQYAFCVCLWEAVFDEHPFPHGQDASTAPTRSKRKVPSWLIRVLERGLAFDPDRRHSSMTVLLDALERAPRIRRRAWTVAAGLAVIGLGALVVMRARSAADPCSSVASLEAWTPEARVATRSAFVASGLPFATQIHDTVAHRLDDYASRWHAMRVEACRASRDGTQSDELFQRRSLCLERRQDEVGALVAAMRIIPRDRVEKAVNAMDTLSDLRACADVDALSRSAPLPQEPVRAERVRALEREIADVDAQYSIGRPEDRSAQVEDLLARARTLEYRPALVRALTLKVALAWDSERWQEFVPLAQEQLVVAEAAGDDRARFRIYTRLLIAFSSRLQRYDEATQAGRLAEALLQRLGGEPALAARLHSAQCMAEWYRGNYEEALRLAKICVAEHERVVPRDEVLLGSALSQQAIAEASLRRFEEALVTSARAVEVMQRTLGERHPDVALALQAQGEIQHDLDRDDLAEPLYRRAISILEESRGGSTLVGSALLSLANLLQGQEKYADAIALYRRGLAIQERTVGPENNRVAATLDMLGKALARSGNLEEGEAMALRSIAIREANGSGDHPMQATAWRILGGSYWRAKQYEKSSKAYARSLRILEKKYGPKHPLVVTSLLGVAEAELDLGHPKVARPLLERALPHLDAPEVSQERGRIQFLLARALWATPGDRARARQLADAAFEIDGSDPEDGPLIAEWRKTHVVP